MNFFWMMHPTFIYQFGYVSLQISNQSGALAAYANASPNFGSDPPVPLDWSARGILEGRWGFILGYPGVFQGNFSITFDAAGTPVAWSGSRASLPAGVFRIFVMHNTSSIAALRNTDGS